jgi:hypothetical protein
MINASEARKLVTIDHEKVVKILLIIENNIKERARQGHTNLVFKFENLGSAMFKKIIDELEKRNFKCERSKFSDENTLNIDWDILLETDL